MFPVFVQFYKTEAQRNAAFMKLIETNSVMAAETITFSNDERAFFFEYIGMEKQEWYGYTTGIKVMLDDGTRLVFATWNEIDETEMRESIDMMIEGVKLVVSKKSDVADESESTEWGDSL